MMLINAAVVFVVPALTILFGATVAAINDAGVVEARIASFSIGAVALSVGIAVAGIGAGALLPRGAAPRGFGDS